MYRKHQKVSLFFSLFLFVIFLMMASAVSFLYSNELSISILQFVRFSDVYYTGHCCGTVVQSWSIERSQLTAALPPTVFLSQFRWFPRRHKNNIEACSHLSQFEFESAFHQTVLKKKNSIWMTKSNLEATSSRTEKKKKESRTRRLGFDRSRRRNTILSSPCVMWWICVRYTGDTQTQGGGGDLTETIRVWLAPSDDKKRRDLFRSSTTKKNKRASILLWCAAARCCAIHIYRTISIVWGVYL
jgi:hypothetical protein